jgi:hypothetical protein
MSGVITPRGGVFFQQKVTLGLIGVLPGKGRELAKKALSS